MAMGPWRHFQGGSGRGKIFNHGENSRKEWSGALPRPPIQISNVLALNTGSRLAYPTGLPGPNRH